MLSVLSSSPLEDIEEGIRALAAEPLVQVSGEELVELQRLQDKLAAEAARRLAVFDRERGFAADGHGSTKAWLRAHCRLSHSAATMRVSVARQLVDLPDTRRAFAEGEITFAHAASICRTADALGTELVAGAEHILVPAARELNAGKFGYVTRCLRHTVDPDGALRQTVEEREGSYLHLSESWKGCWYLDGRLDAELGAILNTALDALMSQPVRDDNRCYSQRRAEALAELARRQLDGGRLPQVAGVKPHLSVVVTEETLKAVPGAPTADLEWGPPIHSETARRIACDCAVNVVTVDRGGELLDYGRTRRTVPPALRRVLVIRDGGCAWPGCDRPPAWTSGHHLKHWADGGPTNKENTALLCGHHHWRAHEGGWRLQRGPDGRLLAVPP